MSAVVTNLQATVGNINTNVADLSAKIDQLLNASLSGGSRKDCAMGVGKDATDTSDTAPAARKKVKVAEGAAAASASTA